MNYLFDTLDTDDALKDAQEFDSTQVTMSQKIADMRQSSNKHDKLLITVIDTGNGIKTKHQDSIFLNLGLLGSNKQTVKSLFE